MFTAERASDHSSTCSSLQRIQAIQAARLVEGQAARLGQLLGDLVRSKVLAYHSAAVLLLLQMMCLLVGVQIGLLVEAFVAAGVRAGEWLLARVDPQVRLQIEVERELLAALIARVWLLTLDLTTEDQISLYQKK